MTVFTRVNFYGRTIEEAGVRLVPFQIDRSGLNPIGEVATLIRLIRSYRRLRPDVAHHVAIKPILYGTIAARLTGGCKVVNVLPGLGWLFTSAHPRAKVLRVGVRWALRLLLPSGTTVVFNADDRRFLLDLGLEERLVRQIRGSGVDLNRFVPRPEPGGPPVVLLPARLLWDKGVAEFVAAARILQAKGISARWVLAGEPDQLNPAAIPESALRQWAKEGVVEHLGWVSDMPSLFAASHVVCLPSYREGLPRSLMEAAAAGRPIVATDTPGCREVVRHNYNGLLVPSHNADALASALAALITNPDLRRAMGARGRVLAEREFSAERAIAQMLSLYAHDTP